MDCCVRGCAPTAARRQRRARAVDKRLQCGAGAVVAAQRRQIRVAPRVTSTARGAALGGFLEDERSGGRGGGYLGGPARPDIPLSGGLLRSLRLRQKARGGGAGES